MGPSRIAGPGRALTQRAARAGGFAQVPKQVAEALQGLGYGYLIPTWVGANLTLWRMQGHQAKKGGIKPVEFKAKLRADRHLKTVERHLRLLDQLGFLERNRVKGCPRRGPGTRVRYWLLHALNLKPLAAFADGPPPPASPAPSEPATDAIDAPRGPPEIDRAASAAAARAVLDELQGR